MKVEAHKRYKTEDGHIVPGVTTVLGILNKPALVKWANNLGLQGIDSSKYVDKMATIGTIAHYLINCQFSGEIPDLEDYAPKEIKTARNCLMSFYDWKKSHDIVTFFSEKSLVNEKFLYGGTIDLYCKIDGKINLVDFKSSNKIYPEMIIQLAAYRNLLEENGFLVEECRILRIGRDESEGWEELKIANTETYLEVFKHTLEIYRLKKIIDKGAKA